MHNVENVCKVCRRDMASKIGFWDIWGGGGGTRANPTFDHSAEVCLTVCPEHNGHMRRKKHVVELLRMLNITRYSYSM